MRILVIDDEIHVATLLADAVREQGHAVTVAHDGDEGLALLQHSRPDAVFLDVKLGELSGIEVLRRIRRADRRLPVILVTGHAVADELKEARQLGVTEIVEKPFVLKQLSGALSTLETRP